MSSFSEEITAVLKSMDAPSIVRLVFASTSFVTVHICSYVVMFSSSALSFLDGTAIYSILLAVFGVMVLCLTVASLFVFMLSTESPSKSLRIDRERGELVLPLSEYDRKHRSRTSLAVLIVATLPICGFVFKSLLAFLIFVLPILLFCSAYFLTLFWNATNGISYPRRAGPYRVRRIFNKRKRFALKFIWKDFGGWASVRLFILISTLAASSGIARYIANKDNIDYIRYGEINLSGAIVFRSNSGIALLTNEKCLFVYQEGLIIEFTICKAN